MGTHESSAPGRDRTNAPPRLKVSKDSLAATYAIAQSAGVPIAADFPLDEARNILGEIGALLEVLSAGFHDANIVGKDDTAVGEMTLVMPVHLAHACDGLARLSRLADFHILMGMGGKA